MAAIIGWVEILLDWDIGTQMLVWEVQCVHLVVGVWQRVVWVKDLGSPGSAPGDII